MENLGLRGREILVDPVVELLESSVHLAADLLEVLHLAKIGVVGLVSGAPLLLFCLGASLGKVARVGDRLWVSNDVALHDEVVPPRGFEMIIHVVLAPGELVGEGANGVGGLLGAIVSVIAGLAQIIGEGRDGRSQFADERGIGLSGVVGEQQICVAEIVP